jgi:hypothetical protein
VLSPPRVARAITSLDAPVLFVIKGGLEFVDEPWAPALGNKIAISVPEAAFTA